MMHHSTPSNQYQRSCLFSSLIIFSSLISFSRSDPRITESGLYCGNSTSTSMTLIPTFVKEMEGLSQRITTTHFATYSYHLSNSSSNTNNTKTVLTLYALAQCHDDLSQTDCLLCYAASRTRLPRCLPSLSSRLYLDGCFLRYADYNFYNESVSPSTDTVKCSGENFTSSTDGNDDRRKMDFIRSVTFAVGNVTSKAMEEGKGFGVVGVKEGGVSVYALGQCWESLGREGCRECLEEAGKAVLGRCLLKKEGRGMNAGCYLRYSTDKFYNDEGDYSGHGHVYSSLLFIVAVALAAAAFLLLSIFLAYAGYVRLLKKREERKNLGKISINFNKSGLNFKYETLEKATNFFNQSRKVGQGGNGSVFMGTLQDGQVVAVKRLIFNSRQWVDEFFNEVNLISGIQHKNLVKLLGCSIEGPESLLVYEYVPNKSLDHFLFDKNRSRTLNWKQRYDIIVGTAEGLAYLHEGSEVRIIHRDIKSSNVLLDEDLTPKISDFGLARCFGAEMSHLSTGIAGTIGYMAPEYLIRGKLTEKADVYSYGVLVLEIVTGKRCNAFVEESSSLIQKVWQLYRSNRLIEVVDPSLGNDFPAEEASCVLQIGLLCIQASVTSRPSMSQVVWMLTNYTNSGIPEPNQPPFMNANVLLGPDSSMARSYNSTNSLVSNAATKVEASSTSSECGSVRSPDGPSRSQKEQGPS